MLYSKRG